MATLLQGLYVLHARLQPSADAEGKETSEARSGMSGGSNSSPATSSAAADTQDSMGLHALLPTPRAALQPLLCYTAPRGETTLYEPSHRTTREQQEEHGKNEGRRADGQTSRTTTIDDVLQGKEAMRGVLECFTGELLWQQARQMRARHLHEKYNTKKNSNTQQVVTTTTTTIAASVAPTADEVHARLSWQCLPIAENGLYIQTPTAGYVHSCHRLYQQQQCEHSGQHSTPSRSIRALQAQLRQTGALPYMDEVHYYAEHAAHTTVAAAKYTKEACDSSSESGEGYDYGYALFLDAASCELSAQPASAAQEQSHEQRSEHTSKGGSNAAAQAMTKMRSAEREDSTRWVQESEGVVLCLTAASPSFNFLRSLALELLPVLVGALHEVRNVRPSHGALQDKEGTVFDEWAVWLSQVLDERLSRAVRGLTQASHSVQRLLPGEALALQLSAPSHGAAREVQGKGRQGNSHTTSDGLLRQPGSVLRRPPDMLYPYLDTPLAILLASFPYTALRVLHTLLLQEQRVIILGVSPQHASACVVAMPALLSPLHYCGTLVPYLPTLHATSCGLLDTLLLAGTCSHNNSNKNNSSKCATAVREAGRSVGGNDVLHDSTCEVASAGFVVGSTAELVPHVLLRLNAFVQGSSVKPSMTPLYLADARTGNVGPVPTEALRAVLQDSSEGRGLQHTSASHVVRFTRDAALLRKLQTILTQPPPPSLQAAASAMAELALLPHEDKLKAVLKKVMKREQRLAFRALIELLARRAKQRAQVVQDVEAGCLVRRARRRALRHRHQNNNNNNSNNNSKAPHTTVSNASMAASRYHARLHTPVSSAACPSSLGSPEAAVSALSTANTEEETDELLSDIVSLEAADLVSQDGTEWNEKGAATHAGSLRENVLRARDAPAQDWTEGGREGGNQGSEELPGMLSSTSSSSSSSSTPASSSSSSSAASDASSSDEEAEEGGGGKEHNAHRPPATGTASAALHKSFQAADKAQRAAMASAMQRVGQLTHAPVCPIDELASLEAAHAALLQYNVQWIIGNHRARLQPISSYNSTRDVVVAGSSMSTSSLSISAGNIQSHTNNNSAANNEAGQRDLQLYLLGPADVLSNNSSSSNTTMNSALSPPSQQRALRLVSQSHSYRQFMAALWCAESLGLVRVLRGAYLDPACTANNITSITSKGTHGGSNNSSNSSSKAGMAYNIYVRHPRMLLLLGAFYGRAVTLFPSYYGDLAGVSLLRTGCGLVQALVSPTSPAPPTSTSNSISNCTREAVAHIRDLLFLLGGEGSNNSALGGGITGNNLTEAAGGRGGGTTNTSNAYGAGKTKSHKGMKGIFHKAKKMVKKLGATGKPHGHHHGTIVRMDGFVQTLGNTSAGLRPALAEHTTTRGGRQGRRRRKALDSVYCLTRSPHLGQSPQYGSPGSHARLAGGTPAEVLPVSCTPTSPYEFLATRKAAPAAAAAAAVTTTTTVVKGKVSKLNEVMSEQSVSAPGHRDRELLARAPLTLCRPLPLDTVHQFASYHRLLDPRRATVYTQYYTTKASEAAVAVDERGQVSTLMTSAAAAGDDARRRDVQGNEEAVYTPRCARQKNAQAALYRTLGFLCPACVPMWRMAEQLRLSALLAQQQEEQQEQQLREDEVREHRAVVTPSSRPFITQVEDNTNTAKLSAQDKLFGGGSSNTAPHPTFRPVTLDELWSQNWAADTQPVQTAHDMHGSVTSQAAVFAPVSTQASPLSALSAHPTAAAHEEAMPRESTSPVLQRFTLLPQPMTSATPAHVDAFASDWGVFTSGVPEGYIAPPVQQQQQQQQQQQHYSAAMGNVCAQALPAGGANALPTSTTTWWTPNSNNNNDNNNTGANATVQHAKPASPHDLLDELFGPSPHA